MADIKRIFRALDVGKTGYIEKEDLITLRQRKRLARRLRREARKNKGKKSWEYMI
jgi:Ca2+-binding EF-hand superfamily protein